ncbi:MAG: hypothetical protein QM744_05735 [Mesorhizobium sp.]
MIAFFSAPVSARPNPCAKRISMHPAAFAYVRREAGCDLTPYVREQTLSDYEPFALPNPPSAIETCWPAPGPRR